MCTALGSRQGLGAMEMFGSSGFGYHHQGAPSREQLMRAALLVLSLELLAVCVRISVDEAGSVVWQ